MKRCLLAAILAAAAAAGARGAVARAVAWQDNALEPERTPVLQNDTLAVTRLRFAPGARETSHTHPFPILLVQISPGQFAVQGQNATRRGAGAGEVWYVPAGRPHAVTRQGEAGNLEMIAIALLPDRPAAQAAPPTGAPPGITRLTLVDNGEVRVVRVRFAPDGREPPHTHPNDLLTVQITRGRVEIVNGSERSTEVREPGFVQFLPRNVQHTYASADTRPFELLSVAIK